MPNLSIFAISIVAALAIAGQHAVPTSVDHQFELAAQRGRAQAYRDLVANKPVKLYAHRFDGRAPGYMTPGLIGCTPNWSKREAAALFAPLPDADWAEGQAYTEEQLRTAQIARSYARAYNLEIFKARRPKILPLCPDAHLQ